MTRPKVKQGLDLLRVAELVPGDSVDLEGDKHADSPSQCHESDHPEFEFELEVVCEVKRETPDCILLEFESGFACGFPADYSLQGKLRPETPVIFRKWPKREGGDVIALFPAELGTYDPYTCGSYQHVGQHGSADPHMVVNATKKAKPEEYADLKRELESAPYHYRFRVYEKLQRTFLKTRQEEARRLRNLKRNDEAAA